MQIEPQLTYEAGNNEAHVPVPLLVGTRGWGLFVPDDHPALFEVATDDDELVQVTFGMGMAGNAGLACEKMRTHVHTSAHSWRRQGAAPARAA